MDYPSAGIFAGRVLFMLPSLVGEADIEIHIFMTVFSIHYS